MLSRRMNVFLKVAETGSFTKAAEKLYITPSAVVQQMNTLEEDLNCRLMDRTNKGVRLTCAGELLLSRGTQIARECDELARELALLDNPGNTLHLGTHMLFKSTCFKQLWPEFHAAHPELQLENQYFSFYETAQSDIDLMEGVNFRWDMDATRTWHFLGQTPLVILAPRSHPLAGSPRVGFSDLLPYPVVTPDLDRMSPVLEQFNRDAESAGIRVERAAVYDPPLFDRCEMENLLLQIPLSWAGLAPNMLVIPLEEAYLLPYGFLVSRECSSVTTRFLEYVKARKPRFDFLVPDVTD